MREQDNCADRSGISPELLREIGKGFFFGKLSTEETKNNGLRLIIRACKQNDPEAMFIVSKLMLDGIIKPMEGTTEKALTLMCHAANRGCIQARAYLNAYCEERYADTYDTAYAEPTEGELLDFDGKPIRINRQGIFTPIDAVLEHNGNKNILTLKSNIMFVGCDEMVNFEPFAEAVVRGIESWAGEYVVFGGQPVVVRVELTNENNIFDNLLIIPITSEIGNTMERVSAAIGTRKKKARISDLLANKRSFALNGIKWTATSRKIICIQSHNGRFDDYDEIMHVAKHEFGHAIGLGDLYSEPGNSLAGVEIGTYRELDSYAITDKYYNLVMCDHHGPVSNNDIEMVILAFRENKMQHYQPRKIKMKVSAALGKGN